jgi:hypothetical protein
MFSNHVYFQKYMCKHSGKYGQINYFDKYLTRPMKRYSISLIIRAVKNKPKMNCPFISIRIMFKRLTIPSTGKDVNK